MQVISIPDMKKMITHVAVGMREPVMFWGMPGCGKSEGVAQAASDLGAALVDIRLSQYDSVDLRGIPVPTDEELTVWHAPSTLPFKGNDRFGTEDPILLFLDEINSAAPAVAAVAYQLINDRAVGEHELLDNVIVVAAGNRESDKGVTNRMPTPLANRFTHAEIDLDVQAWCEWAQDAGLPPEGVAFMNFRKPLLSTFDDALKTGAKAFATPRTWTKALKYYASDMPQNIKQIAMTGAVGEGPSAEFWGFVDVWQDMTPIEDIIADPNGVAVPEKAAMRYATAVAVSSEMDRKNVGALSTFLMRLDPEFSILAWQLAMRRDIDITTTNEFAAFAKKYNAVLAR